MTMRMRKRKLLTCHGGNLRYTIDTRCVSLCVCALKERVPRLELDPLLESDRPRSFFGDSGQKQIEE